MKKSYTKIISKALIYCLILQTPFLALAKSKKSDEKLEDNQGVVQTLNPNLEATVYGYKKDKYYTAVEVGFTNLTDNYIPFTPKELYLDEQKSYSKPLLSMESVRDIEMRRPGHSLFPLVAAAGLGIAALATTKANGNVAYGLGVGAVGMVAASYFTKAFENRAQQGKFISFDTNSISEIKRLPPGMTLGGTLYFAPTKNPKSLTMMVKKDSGGYEKRVFDIDGLVLKKSKK